MLYLLNLYQLIPWSQRIVIPQSLVVSQNAASQSTEAEALSSSLGQVWDLRSAAVSPEPWLQRLVYFPAFQMWAFRSICFGFASHPIFTPRLFFFFNDSVLRQEILGTVELE